MKRAFRTELTWPKADFEVSYRDHICAVGSCFAENMSGLLQQGGFSVEVNPFGILYNPVSIADTLQLQFGEQPFPEENLVQQGELWYSFLHHGRFAALSREELLDIIQAELAKARISAKKCTKLMLTLGSSTVYEYRQSGKIVANCHKIPNNRFSKYRLTVSQCTDQLLPVLQLIKEKNPGIEIILSVSPVRHLREGFTENQLSKSTLLLCCEELQRQLSFVHYFPAYEIMMDDLRDYRFYHADMVHPNEVATAYIWEQFRDCFFSEETCKIHAEISDFQRMKSHRPLHPETREFSELQQKIAEKAAELRKKYPFLPE